MGFGGEDRERNVRRHRIRNHGVDARMLANRFELIFGNSEFFEANRAFVDASTDLRDRNRSRAFLQAERDHRGASVRVDLPMTGRGSDRDRQKRRVWNAIERLEHLGFGLG